MNCRNCKREIPDNAVLCPYCGQSVKAPVQGDPATAKPPTEAQAAPPAMRGMARLQEAVEAIRRGEIQRGKQLLAEVLQADPHNAEAWLQLAAVIDEPDRKAECLRRARDTQQRNAALPTKTDQEILEEEIVSRTRAGWHLVDHTPTLVQFKKPRRWNATLIILTVTLPLIGGCFWWPAYIVAAGGLIGVIANYLLQQELLEAVTAQQLRERAYLATGKEGKPSVTRVPLWTALKQSVPALWIVLAIGILVVVTMMLMMLLQGK